MRRILHQTGFYEVAVLGQQGKYDASTVGFFPDGQFDLHGQQPGLLLSPKSWGTHSASRLAIGDHHRLPWRNVTANPIVNLDGVFSAQPGELALAVTRLEKGMSVPARMEVRGVMHWTRANRGHAALVACYAGPGDSQMYATLFEAGQGANGVVSLWLNDEKWMRLASAPLPDSLVRSEETVYSVPLWLGVDAYTVTVGSGESCLLKQQHNGLTRTPSVGIRIAEDAISISDLSYTFAGDR
jgi:hypothetical protein